MVSFDVVSLFTNVPWSALMWMKPSRPSAIDYSRMRHLGMDKHSHFGTSPPCGTVPKAHLLSVWCIFLWAGVRGSKGLTANHHGRPGYACLEYVPCKLKMWLRYIDDIFAIWPHGEHLLETFHQYLNTQNPSIQFTMERELEGNIAFLDVQLERRGTTALTSVCTNRHTLTGTSTSPCQGIQRNRSALEGQSREGMWQGKARAMAGDPTPQTSVQGQWLYPEPVMKRNLRGRPTPTNTTIESETHPKLLLLPYVRGFSEQIKKMCRPLGVRTVMKSASTSEVL